MENFKVSNEDKGENKMVNPWKCSRIYELTRTYNKKDQIKKSQKERHEPHQNTRVVG